MLSRIRDLGELATAVGQAQVGSAKPSNMRHPALARRRWRRLAAALRRPCGSRRAEPRAPPFSRRHSKAGPASPVVRNAVSGLYGASLLLRRHQHFLRLAGVHGPLLRCGQGRPENVATANLRMWKETNIAGVFMAPILPYMLVALIIYRPFYGPFWCGCASGAGPGTRRWPKRDCMSASCRILVAFF